MNTTGTGKRVLSDTNGGYDIFKKYLPDWDGSFNRKIISPFSGKKSISLKQVSGGMYIYRDWLDETHKGDAIAFVMHLLNISFGDAVDTICNDIIPAYSNKRVIPAAIDYVPADVHYQWCIPLEEDMSYWEDTYGLHTEYLHYYGVYAVSKFRKITIEGENTLYTSWIYATKDNPIFIYKYNHVELNGDNLNANTHKVAFYMPLNPNRAYKFQGNKGKSDIFGLTQCVYAEPDGTQPLYIMGGQKDVLNVVHNFDVAAIALQSESTTYIPQLILDYINRSYSNVYVIYDNDDVGRDSANTLCDLYGFINHTDKFHAQCPTEGYKPKDISDYIMAGIPVVLPELTNNQ